MVGWAVMGRERFKHGRSKREAPREIRQGDGIAPGQYEEAIRLCPGRGKTSLRCRSDVRVADVCRNT